jgi:DNA-binding Lrp family transcriptional regulator
VDVDQTDSALIAELRKDGRATFEALAGRVGLSRTAARARIQRLLDLGAIRIVGMVHPSVYGLHALGHVSLEISGPAMPIAEKIAAMEDAPFVSVVSGRFGVVAELRSPSMDTFASALDSLRALDGVRNVETGIYTAIVKDTHFPPGRLRPVELDDVDRHLLAALQLDGRAAFSDLAEKVRLSPGAVRARVLRLIDHGIVHVIGLVDTTVLGFTQACGFAVWVARPVDETVASIAHLAQVEYLASAVGRCDIIGTLVGATRADVVTALDRLRQIPGVRRLETWSHLTLVKEKYDRSPLEPFPLH